MKTRKSPLRQVSLKLLLVLPLFLFTVLALNSCSASKKAGRLKTEIAPPPIVRDDEPFVVVEEMPLFQGGDSMLLAYIGKNTKYPEAAKLNNI